MQMNANINKMSTEEHVNCYSGSHMLPPYNLTDLIRVAEGQVAAYTITRNKCKTL